MAHNFFVFASSSHSPYPKGYQYRIRHCCPLCKNVVLSVLTTLVQQNDRNVTIVPGYSPYTLHCPQWQLFMVIRLNIFCQRGDFKLPTAPMDSSQILMLLLQKRSISISKVLRRSNMVEFTTELQRRLVLSQKDKDKFDSLDFNTVDVSLQIRYVLQLVTQKILKEPSVFENFLKLLPALIRYFLNLLRKITKMP